MSTKKLLDWADDHIRPEAFGRFLDYGISADLLTHPCDLQELFLEYEAEVEEVLEDEMRRTGLDREELLEYTEELEAPEELLRWGREKAFATAVMLVACKRRDSD
jgi:hypothetical protein